tara:strand:+ start:8663 stop:8968 length:306 start_codon:yes stop_codon:yes gene_type:complete
MTISKEFKCDVCSQEIDIEDVGYLGDLDNGDECNEFMTLVTICRNCLKKMSLPQSPIKEEDFDEFKSKVKKAIIKRKVAFEFKGNMYLTQYAKDIVKAMKI